ncbi:class II aldolase/adducin family protein [Hyperthermus butylicus]|uniref:L-fuculose phosphate aldolase n=1 Tax=Hyperthermus butylicus (strain DSM 5456 / JCM 9403 / PLM1-5) TaxID=415426 RepID=A2BKY3_HYPBU|nr:class II aldolase/adducin family protein [Hyperthermus butylicus]ABM80644.1 L-fuculose phosphate aldolase [Hyperthermus butylicus DSM 5456]
MDRPIGLEVRRALVEAMRILHDRGLVNLLGGNASVRVTLPDGTTFIYITPSGAVKPLLSPEDIAVIGLDGTVYEGKPSIEYRMHLAVYRSRSNVRAVVHAHNTRAVLAAALGVELDPNLLGVEAKYYLGGCVGRVGAYEPGSEQLAEAVASALKDCNVAILEKHGAVAVGVSDDPRQAIYEAVDRLEVLEELAEASLMAEVLRRVRIGH